MSKLVQLLTLFHLAISPVAAPAGEGAVQSPSHPWFPKAPPLPPPTGEVVRVATVEDLFAAVERAKPGVTDSAERLAQVPDDIDKQPRGEKPDLGADER